MARTDTLGNFLTDVADAIRTKKGTSEQIQASTFDTEIANLPTGGDDLSEYFVTDITEDRISKVSWDLLKKIPELHVANNVTQLSYLFDKNYYSLGNAASALIPKVVCGSNVTNMSHMYSNTSANALVTSINLSGLDMSNVTTVSNMFENKTGIISIDLSHFDGKKLSNTGFTYIFDNCFALQKIDLSNFEPISVIRSTYSFNNCYKLAELDIDKWDLGTYPPNNFSNMFTSCGLQLSSGEFTKIYVKDQAAQNWILTAANGHPTDWTTDNVIIAGSAEDLRNS